MFGIIKSYYAKHFFPQIAVPATPITKIIAAYGAVSPVFGAAVTPLTESFTTEIGERDAVANVTEPAETLLGAITSQALPL